MTATQTSALEVVPQSQLAAPEYVEQNVSMVQQYATARIQSAYMVALQRPRNVDTIRQNVLKECSRPSFCVPDESKNGSSLAIYRLPRGGTNITGPTIRFAEMMLREWKYLSVEIVPMGEDKDQRLLQVILTDYQACNCTSEIVPVPKSVERKRMKPGDDLISQRTNTYGEPVYLVKATDDELAMRTNALVSKARRNLILQAVPGWLIEEAVDQVRITARTKDAQDPDAAKRKLFDAFAVVGVTAAQLTEYLGHSNALSPAELEDLRGYYSGIREGYTTWAAIVASKDEQDDGSGEKLDDLFKQLGETPAKMRKIKGQYVGRTPELIAYLEQQVAKMQNTGAKPAETAKADEPQQEQPEPEPQETRPQAAPPPKPSPVTKTKQAPPPVASDWDA